MASRKKRAAFLMLIASSFHYPYETPIKTRKKRKWWVAWLRKREESGAYARMLQELRLQDAEHFRKYLRMNTDTYVCDLKNVVASLQGADEIQENE